MGSKITEEAAEVVDAAATSSAPDNKHLISKPVICCITFGSCWAVAVSRWMIFAWNWRDAKAFPA